MGLRCIREFTDLMRGEARKFCEQSPPANEAELGALQAQATALTAKIGAIAHAGGMAKVYPAATVQVFQIVKAFCDRVPLTNSVFGELSGLAAEVGKICHAEAMRQLTSSKS